MLTFSRFSVKGAISGWTNTLTYRLFFIISLRAAYLSISRELCQRTPKNMTPIVKTPLPAIIKATHIVAKPGGGIGSHDDF